jgi:hypothetical protein
MASGDSVDPAALCVIVHRRVLRHGIQQVPAIAEMQGFVTCLQHCTAVLALAAPSAQQFTAAPPATIGVTAAAAPAAVAVGKAPAAAVVVVAAAAAGDANDRAKQRARIRPFVVDAVREIVRVTLGLIPESTKSNYAQCMRDIVMLGARIARQLLEENDLELLDVLQLATAPAHPMYRGRLTNEPGKYVRGSPQVRAAVIKDVPLGRLRDALLGPLTQSPPAQQQHQQQQAHAKPSQPSPAQSQATTAPPAQVVAEDGKDNNKKEKEAAAAIVVGKWVGASRAASAVGILQNSSRSRHHPAAEVRFWLVRFWLVCCVAWVWCGWSALRAAAAHVTVLLDVTVLLELVRSRPTDPSPPRLPACLPACLSASPSAKVQALVGDFLGKLQALEAADFDLVNNETHSLERLVQALQAITGALESATHPTRLLVRCAPQKVGCGAEAG